MAQRVKTDTAAYEAKLPDFASRILYVRCVLLRVNRLKMAELIGQSHASLANWEHGKMPHQIVAVASAYAKAAQEVAPDITASWLLFGEGDFPLYADIHGRESLGNVA